MAVLHCFAAYSLHDYFIQKVSFCTKSKKGLVIWTPTLKAAEVNLLIGFCFYFSFFQEACVELPRKTNL